jgi:uncharacterized protein (DUF433 family)
LRASFRHLNERVSASPPSKTPGKSLSSILFRTQQYEFEGASRSREHGFQLRSVPGRALVYSKRRVYSIGQLGTRNGNAGFLAEGERKMQNVIIKNPNILGGEPVFRGTRVPFRILTDYLEGGDTLDDFLEQYPTVSRELAIAAIEEARSSLVSQLK